MYFWTLNSNMFPEFLYHPHLLCCIRLCDRTRLHCVCESLGACTWCKKPTVTWRTRVTNSPLQLLARAQCVTVSEVRSVCSAINMPRKCVNSSDAFCYICGEVTFKSRGRSFTPLIKKCYEHYFGSKVGHQDKSLPPHFCCVTCARRLAAWTKGSLCMPFAIPMVWREPTDHVSDCYFCLTIITGVTAKSKHTVQYPNLPSAMRPVPHSTELSVPKTPTNMTLSDSESSDEDVGQANNNMNCDPAFAGASSSNEPHLLNRGGPEWYRPRFEPVKEASWTFRPQVKGLESSAPGY